ncbi:uncharacterized protein LOC129909357 [Episyrphus balteatus]|uniref:uncharacterized protein LOC129909357 n=1 Tax=Episyrphus balteatus TaxID=286459 RepID=UPI0024857544|nr:uncharacterized protein LOC129909357 [Episyrphus balteatus]
MTILWKNLNLIHTLIGLLFIFDLTSKVVSQYNNNTIRLPTFIQPKKYNLHITSNIHDNVLTFNGSVIIEFAVKVSTSEIVLHAKDLRDIVICLIENKNRRFENLKYKLEKDTDFLRISAPKRLNSGENYRLEIVYNGNIQEEFYGLYKTSYLDEFYNQSIPLAVTQFESNSARLAFPCFDEPSFRAKFVITITHGRFYTALSNMPIDGQPRWNANMITTTFRETPPMSTYLVGFVICNFNYISEFVNGMEHRTFFPPNAKDFGTRALTNAIQSVAFLERYLGIDYPLPKLDHIHVKDSAVSGISWGLAVYSDDEFLQTLEHRDQTVKRIVLQNFIISQQWFSNMVPAKWWSYMWINSGLATYFSYKITDSVYPTWEMENYFILIEMKDLMNSNVDKPLVREVETVIELEEITSEDAQYRMGAGLIKMFHHAIGDETFTKGIITYLNHYKNSAADEDDFLRSMQAAIKDDYVYIFQNDKTLIEVMKTWTHNQGIPTVKVTRHYNGTVTIRQKPNSNKFQQRWWIPLNFATASNGNFSRTTADYIMPPFTEVSIDLEDINVSLMNKDWLILNKQQTGLYYTVYDDRNLELIAEALNRDHSSIHMLNRALLFRDLKAIIDTDLGAIEPVLNAIQYLKYEQESMPWFEGSELINEIWSRLKDGKAYNLFRTFIHDIVGNFYHNFFETPLYELSFADSIVQKSIYKLACEVEFSECLAHAKHQYKEYFHRNWPIDESMKKYMLCKGMQGFSLDELKEILHRILYITVKMTKEDEFLDSLECIRSQDNINLVYEYLQTYKMKFINLSATRIDTYMSLLHPSFMELKRKYGRTRSKRYIDRIQNQKNAEFKSKYEDKIYSWLKNYELEQQTNIDRRFGGIDLRNGTAHITMTSTRRKISFLPYSWLLILFCGTMSALDSPNFKLPSAILPTKYYLHIHTLIHQNILNYNGSVSIDLIVKEQTNEIVLNVDQLRDLNVTLLNVDSGLLLESPQIEYNYNEVKQELRIFWPKFPLKLKIGQQYRLKIDFLGDIQEKEKFGFFKSTYLDEHNNSVSIATTQFEPTSARLAFPCFDEPAIKAKFVISITHGTNYSAISNMPIDGEPVLSPNAEMMTTTFLETPKMSTYLVAFILTNYNRSSILANGLEHRFFYPPNSKNNGSRALQNAVKTVDALEKLLNTKYPLPKLDHFQIDKSYGRAMENWGLMSFQQRDILSNHRDYNKLDLLDVINVQNHEIAHQWFGNLVTPASWNYIWLKEGFSSYFSFVAAHLVYPEEKIFEYFIINEVDYVTSMSLYHSLSCVIKDGHEIKKYMDVVAYNLGGSFVRMFHHAIGQPTFIKGLFKYLYIYQYSVADEDDLFEAMQAAVDEDEVHLFQNNQSVANVMRTWTHNQGIPTITVIRNYDNGTITIRQKSNSDNKDQKWWIPMSFATASNPDFERTVADYIMPPEAEVNIDLKDLNISLSNSDWLIVNKQQTGIFYVVYDDLNLKLITQALKKDKNSVHIFNRALIFRDVTKTFEEDLDAIEPVLELFSYLKDEEESLPWFQAVDLILELFPLLEGSNVSEKFRNFINDIFIGIYDQKYKNNFSNFTATDLKTKSKMMKLNFEVDNSKCVNFTTTNFTKNYLRSGSETTVKPCRLSICQGIQNATLEEFQAFFTRNAVLDHESIEFYEFQAAVRCVKATEVFQYIWNTLIGFESRDLQRLSGATVNDLYVSNKFFRKWYLDHYTFSELEEETEEKDDEINKGEVFLNKYENNINTWLENYERFKETK